MPTSRIQSLDSIRGIAALSVLLYHCYLLADSFKLQINNVIETANFPWNILLSLYINLFTSGRSAVIIFFVLSGFVLALSLINRKQSYKKFILSRFLRIYPVLFISVVLAYILHMVIGTNDTPRFANSTWYNFWITPPLPLTIKDLAGHLTLAGITPNNVYLNGPIWSLVHEMRISLILPLLVLLFSMPKKTAMFFVLGIIISMAGEMTCNFLVLTKYVTRSLGFIEETLLYSFIKTPYFLIFFILGIILAVNYEKIRKRIEILPLIAKLFLLLTSIIFLIYYDSSETVFVDYLRGIGAFILIALTFSWRDLEKFLVVPILSWLGKISYSLYLVHWLFVYSISELFGNILLLWQIISIIIILSLIFADLMSRFVEYPCINLGKKLLYKVQ